MVKNSTRRRCRRRCRKTRGGFLGAAFGALNSGVEQWKSNQDNKSYITAVQKRDASWKLKTYPVEYIVPNNFLLFKNPNAFFTPLFQVHLGASGPAKPCYLRIAEPNRPNHIKFIEYFVQIQDPTAKGSNKTNWYAMMRIYGMGINTGFFASWSNVLFYKLNNAWFNLKTNRITLKSGDYVLENTQDNLNVLQKVALTDSSASIARLTRGFTPITDGEMFYVLRQFRNAQTINYDAKQRLADDAVDAAVGTSVV